MSNIYRQAVLSRGQKKQTPQSREDKTGNNPRQNKIMFLNENNNIVQLQPQGTTHVPKRNIFTAYSNSDPYKQENIFGNNVIHKKQPINRFNQTAKQGFRKNVERPQSKQQPRNRGWNKSGLLLKSTLMQSHRPQTSKGQRPRLNYKQKIDDVSHRRNSIQNDQFKLGAHIGGLDKKMQQGFLISSSSASKKGFHSGRFDYKTSIDPEFLSLFAN